MGGEPVVHVWGIHPTVFLLCLWAAWVATLTPGLVHLVRTRTLTHDVNIGTLNPPAVGCVANGRWRAVQASLVWLRFSGAIGAEGGALYTMTNAPPPGASVLDRMVWKACSRGAQVHTLLRDIRVARELDVLTARLERLGLVTRRSTRRGLTIGTTGLIVIGAVSYIVGLVYGHQDEWLIISTLGFGAAGFGLAYAITRPTTATGEYVLRKLRFHYPWRIERHHAPYVAAMACAISGPARLREVDKQFADHAVFIRPRHPWAGIDLTGGSGPTAGYDGGNFAGLGDSGGGGGGGGGGG